MDCLREETVSVSGRSGAQSSVAELENSVILAMKCHGVSSLSAAVFSFHGEQQPAQ